MGVKGSNTSGGWWKTMSGATDGTTTHLGIGLFPLYTKSTSYWEATIFCAKLRIWKSLCLTMAHGGGGALSPGPDIRIAPPLSGYGRKRWIITSLCRVPYIQQQNPTPPTFCAHSEYKTLWNYDIRVKTDIEPIRYNLLLKTRYFEKWPYKVI